MPYKPTFGLGGAGAASKSVVAPKSVAGKSATSGLKSGATSGMKPLGSGALQGANAGAQEATPPLGSGALQGAVAGANSGSTLGSAAQSAALVGLQTGSAPNPTPPNNKSYNPSSYNNYSSSSSNYTPPAENIVPDFNSQPEAPTLPPENISPSNFDTQSFAPPAPTQPSALSSGGSPYSGQITSLRERLKKSKDEYDLYGNPTDEEKDLQAKVDAVNSQLKNLNASKEAGLAEIENQAIPLHFITGQQAALERRASAQAQALAAQAEPLTTKLARLQAQRQLQQEAKKGELAATQDELSQLLGEEKANQPQRIEVGGNLIEYNPVTGGYRTVFSPAQNESYKPIQVSAGATLVDPRTGKPIYQAPVSEKDSTTNDIKEFNLAKGQGFKGTFVDFKRELANLQEKGSTASNLPASYKEYQLTQANPGYGQFLNQNKPQTADQLKAQGFANRLQDADSVINQLEKTGSNVIGSITGSNFFPNAFKSPERQQLEQAERNFVNSVLRRESGAAISPSEFDSAAKQYFPQPGDSSQVLNQKAQNRIRAINNLKLESGKNQQNNQGNRDPLGLGFNQPLSTGLNGSIKTQVATKYPDGSTGGQCTTFLHKIVNFPSIGDGKNEKINSVYKFGIPTEQWRGQERVGDVVVSGDNPTYGHTFLINEILPGRKAKVTESNYHGNEKVTSNRIVSLDSPLIYGAFRGTFKV